MFFVIGLYGENLIFGDIVRIKYKNPSDYSGTWQSYPGGMTDLLNVDWLLAYGTYGTSMVALLVSPCAGWSELAEITCE